MRRVINFAQNNVHLSLYIVENYVQGGREHCSMGNEYAIIDIQGDNRGLTKP